MPVALEEEELFFFLSVLVGASRGASPALVPQRQERAAAPVVLSRYGWEPEHAVRAYETYFLALSWRPR